jgi:hypothetical protein
MTMTEQILTEQYPAAQDGAQANSEQTVDGAPGKPIDSEQGNPKTNGEVGGAADADGTGGVPGATEDTELTPEQLTVLAALADNPDIQSAADAAGVNRATVYRWMKRPAFHEELTRQRNQLFATALAAVKIHAGRAVTQLAGMLDASDERVRRLVCNDILAHGLKVHNLQDIEERITVLERNMKQQKNTQRGR